MSMVEQSRLYQQHQEALRWWPENEAVRRGAEQAQRSIDEAWAAHEADRIASAWERA